MKVNDFAKRLGIGSSKVRYYDRIGLIQGDRCEDNNYRDFSDLDALNIYHAQMLRSFDMSVQESLAAKNKGLNQISSWVEDHISDLEEEIRQQEMRLFRLREMQEYFTMIQDSKSLLTEHDLDENYNVWNFGKHIDLDDVTLSTIKLLSDAMPFSYIAIKISKESILSNQENLDVSIGLGMLERNRKKLGLIFPNQIKKAEKHHILQILVLSDDPFNMKREDLKPLLEEAEKRHIEINEDIVGRIYISYIENGSFVHVIGLSIPLDC